MNNYSDTRHPSPTWGKRLSILLIPGLLLSLGHLRAQAKAQAPTHPQTHIKPAGAQSRQSLSLKEIENSLCLIPNLGADEDYEVRLKNGQYQRGPELVQGHEEGRLSEIATGEINGKPYAAALLTWSTGGTGTWKNLILFQRQNGKVRGTHAYDLAYPLNMGRITALKIVANNLFLDLADIPLAARACASDDDGPGNPISDADTNLPTTKAKEDISTKINQNANRLESENKNKNENKNHASSRNTTDTVSKEEALNAIVCGPSQAEVNSDGSVSRLLPLKAGSYADANMSCQIEQVLQTKLKNEPVTLVAGHLKYNPSKPPIFIAFRLTKRLGKVHCDSCYTLSSEYFQLTFEKIAALLLKDEGNGPLLKVSLAGIKIKPSEFSPASYLKN